MEVNSSVEEILQAFEKVIPYLPNFFEDEISVGLTDKTKFIINQTCPSLPLKSEPGDPIPEGGAAAVAIHTGKVSVKEVPKEIYGVPFKSYAVPLKDTKGDVVGSILIARNLERSKKLLGISKDLSQSFEQIAKAVDQLSKDIQKLAGMNHEIEEKTVTATDHTKGTNEVLNFIENIASQTNLLGLNASIEAARAGEAGKGFQIVSQEIRKMSISTTESVKKISKVLLSVERSVGDISTDIKNSNSIFQSQIEELEQITASMKDLNTTVKSIEELSAQI